jgi:His-Xaa-Ser system radical SAM maturase HxsB
MPFRFLPLDDEVELLSTDWGEWLIEPRGTAAQIARHSVDTGSSLYHRLKAKQFVYDDGGSPLLDLAATKLRTKKRFLSDSRMLHMLVVTARCDHSCRYCQVSRQTADKTQFDMSIESASRSIDLILRSPTRYPTVEFQGGEPFLAFECVRYIVLECKERAAKLGKIPDFVVATNLSRVTDDMLRFCRDQHAKISTSLDGPEFIHNANRLLSGASSYQLAIDGIVRAREIVGFENVSALMTTTRLSLAYPREIIDEYVQRGFQSIFIRSLSPFGFATRAQALNYEIDRFVEFYKTGLDYILELNRNGTPLTEIYAKILLTTILTPFATGFVDIGSPSRAGVSACIIDYDGSVYPSDESRMLAASGDHRFRLGNVHEHTYEELFGSDTLIELAMDGTAEALPGCSDCALQPFCGGDPVTHYATQHDTIGHRPTSRFCQKHMAVLKHLFSLIRRGDATLDRLFWSWIRDVQHDCGQAEHAPYN